MKKITIAVVLTLASALVSMAAKAQATKAQAAKAQPFELKGDFIGESLATFKARHPKAVCKSLSDTQSSCRDPNASFAGCYADPDQEIAFADPNHIVVLPGLTATFFKGKVTQITYLVGFHAGSVDILDVLAAKFGKPNSQTDDRSTAHWIQGKQELVVWVDGEKSGHTQITLFLPDNPANHDI